MKVELMTAQDARWDECLAYFPSVDVYFSAGYHAAHAANGDGEAWAILCTEGTHRLFFSGLIRPIDRVGRETVSDGWCDIQTVYGYSGPLSTTSDEPVLARAWQAVRDALRERNVIAEFIRFHPYLDNHRWAGPGCRVVMDRETVSIDLTGDEDSLWARYPSPQRQKVRQAQRKGVTARVHGLAEAYDVFRRLYVETMRHVGADSYYFFPDAYFDKLAERLGDSIRIFVATHEDRPVAAVLFFASQGRLHYHLGGSSPEARELRPNNLLFHEAARWGQQNGYSTLHLGGGRTAAPDDELLRFKASFSKERRVFRIGMRVYQPDVYEQLCARWLAQQGGHSRPAYFLLYRLPIR